MAASRCASGGGRRRWWPVEFGGSYPNSVDQGHNPREERLGRDDRPVIDVHQLGGIAVGDSVANGVIIDGLDLLDLVGEVGPQPSISIRCLHFPTEDQVIRGHRNSIAPDGIGSQLECQVQAIF